MPDGQHHVDFHRFTRLAPKLTDNAYRNSYVAHQTRQFLARQVRALRGDKSQKEFGALIDKPQNVVSRLENPNYGKWTLQTLFEVAAGLDRAVIVRIVDYPTFLRFTSDMADTAACPEPYHQDAIDELIEREESLTQSSALRAWFLQTKKQTEPPQTAALAASESRKTAGADIISLETDRKKAKDAEEIDKPSPLFSSVSRRAVG